MRDIVTAYIRYKNSLVLSAMTDDIAERDEIKAIGMLYMQKLTPGLIALARSAAEKITCNMEG